MTVSIPRSLAAAAGPAGRFDAQDGDAFGVEILEQIAVVGRDLHHLAGPAVAEPPHHHLDVLLGMGQPRFRKGGVVGIGAVEDVARFPVLTDLHQETRVAHEQGEGVEHLRLGELVGGQKRVGRRGIYQVDEYVRQHGPAASAVHGQTPLKARSINGWLRSLGERARTGSGQRRPNAGSSCRSPPSECRSWSAEW